MRHSWRKLIKAVNLLEEEEENLLQLTKLNDVYQSPDPNWNLLLNPQKFRLFFRHFQHLMTASDQPKRPKNSEVLFFVL